MVALDIATYKCVDCAYNDVCLVFKNFTAPELLNPRRRMALEAAKVTKPSTYTGPAKEATDKTKSEAGGKMKPEHDSKPASDAGQTGNVEIEGAPLFLCRLFFLCHAAKPGF